MKGLLIGLGLGGVAGAIAALAWPKDEEKPPGPAPMPGPALPPTLGGPPIPGSPGEALPQLPTYGTTLPPNVPPQQWPIPGGTFYAGYGYCPPGYALDMKTGQCVPEANAWTQGHCKECGDE